MSCLDNNGNEINVLSEPSEIVSEINNQAVRQGHSFPNEYYLLSESPAKTVISNVPRAMADAIKTKKYLPPKRVNKRTLEVLEYIKECVNLLYNSISQETTQFPDGKEFQLNQCHHNSASFFKLIHHLRDQCYIPKNFKPQIVLGHITRKIPGGSQLGSLGIDNDTLWMQDWHVWNYLNGILVDTTVFLHGNILPPDSSIMSWGSAEDHLYIKPPDGMNYCGCAFNDLNSFNALVGKVIGFA